MNHAQFYAALEAVKAGKLDLSPEDAAEFWRELCEIADAGEFAYVIDAMKDQRG